MNTRADKTAASSVPLHPLLGRRWSPRGFDPEHVLADEQLLALLEAARWAPSASNTQPWRFLVTRRGEQNHARLFAALAPGNALWAGTAGALVLVAAQTADDAGRTQPWALYDTGQAVALMVIQAGSLDLSVHQMGGFDADAVREAFSLDDTVSPVVVLAVGRYDPASRLPEELAAREDAPRLRRPLPELLLEPLPSAGAVA